MDDNNFSSANNNDNQMPNGQPMGGSPYSAQRFVSRRNMGQRPLNRRPVNGARMQQPYEQSYSQQAIDQQFIDQQQDTSGAAVAPKKKKPVAVGILCLLLGILIGGGGVFAAMYFLQKPAECPECDCPQAAPVAALNNLDYDFLKLEAANKNMIYSPLSIENGLALLGAGAAGTTKTEIDKVLGSAEIPKYANVMDKLSLANGVFIRDSLQNDVLPTYVNTVESDYGAEVMYDSFENSSKMDDWVSQKTFGLIKNIGLQTTPNTEMVLTNALAIQMGWQYTFDASNTRGQTFYTAGEGEIEATTMFQNTAAENISYYQGDDATAVTLPLESVAGAELEFAAIMPAGDLGEYVNSLDAAGLEAVLGNTTTASTPKDGVDIYIPKFKFDYALNFKNDLESLGIKQAFDVEGADFSNMANVPLYVSDAIHKANIDFSEEGIKAAAVTAFAMDVKSMAEVEEPQPVVIRIDRPFLFLIRDKANGAVWFVGTVYQPNLWADDVSSYQ